MKIKILGLLGIVIFSLHAMGQNTIHVFSSDIPWNKEPVEKDEEQIYSITEAINLASPGDIIVVHEGIYRETLNLDKNNLTISGATGDYVLVTGSEIVKEWKNANGMSPGVKVADVAALKIEAGFSQLFADGNAKMMARHPNNFTGKMMEPLDAKSGYALLTNVYKDSGNEANGYATLEETTLPNVDLTGGIFRGMTGKMRNYVYGEITANVGNRVTFKAINKGVWKNHEAITHTQHKFSWGYVLHKNLIDYPGEWFLDDDKLYYLPENSASFDTSKIEVQVRERVLVLNNSTGTNINNINFMAGNVDMQSTNSATIENCTFRYLYPFWIPNGYGQGDTDKTGIYLSESSNNKFQNTYMGHSWGNMVAIREGENNSFENCIIEDFGWVGVFTSGIHMNKTDNTSISKCTFGDAGRFQIRIDGNEPTKLEVSDCDFYNSMKMGEDAGPIEATSTGKIGALNLKESVFAYNKIHDVKGIPVSDGGYKRVKATAFYMEDTENYTVHHNLIYNIQHEGYDGPHDIEKVGEFLYMGPRYNAMHHPVNFYNNTIWDVDANISIWNIEIDNWKELGLAPPDTTGMMDDGHFVNNIFMRGPKFKISYVRQKLSSTGGNLGYVSLNPSPSFETDNFTQYVIQCANLNYHFNPMNNVHYRLQDENKIFQNATSGNFNLIDSSPAKEKGTVIKGITSSDTPDCGALEGGDRVLKAGSYLELPKFKEITKIKTAVNKPMFENSKLSLYPNPANNFITINGLKSPTAIEIYSIFGQKVKSESQKTRVNISELKTGVYFIRINNQNLKFIKN